MASPDGQFFLFEWEGGSGLGEVIKYCVNNWMQKMGKGDQLCVCFNTQANPIVPYQNEKESNKEQRFWDFGFVVHKSKPKFLTDYSSSSIIT